MIAKTDDEWHLLSNEGNSVRDYRNAKTVGKESDSTHGGFRVKLSFTILASGHMADLCVVVSGLDEKELPMTEDELIRTKGIKVIKVPGLNQVVR